MVVVGVVLAALVLVLGIATVYMAVYGGLGIVGVVRYVRCPRCGHLTIESGTGPPEHCGHCRHLLLYHPLHCLHDLPIWHREALSSSRGEPGLSQPLGSDPVPLGGGR